MFFYDFSFKLSLHIFSVTFLLNFNVLINVYCLYKLMVDIVDTECVLQHISSILCIEVDQDFHGYRVEKVTFVMGLNRKHTAGIGVLVSPTQQGLS